MKFVAKAGFIPTSFRTLLPLRAVRPAEIDEAVSAIADSSAPAVLAGGTDLPARFNEGFCPTDIIDISRIEALRTIKLSQGAIEIGAAVTHATGAAHPLIREKLPSFAEAWGRIANVRIRFSATLGGNLMARRTRYEGAILLSALGARLRLHSATGDRECAAEDIWSIDPTHRALLTSIIIPLRKGLRLDYARELRPIMTQALALADEGPGRVVTATEHAVPRVRAIVDCSDPNSVRGDLELDDPVTGAAYIKQVSATLLVRQLERMRMQ